MDCPLCHARNPASAARCLKCDAVLPVDALTLTEGHDPRETLDVDFAKRGYAVLRWNTVQLRERPTRSTYCSRMVHQMTMA